MPDSMFGRPLQHLLPSNPQPSAGATSDPPKPPIQPLAFKEFRFNAIGKQPELLSRISLSQPDNTGYHSPSPSPTSTPPPTFTNDLPSKSSSRPTLLQQLAGNNFSSMARWNTSTTQPTGSLASRIQMNSTPSNDIADPAYDIISRLPTPPLRISTVGRATEDASLIPPVEVLPQPPDSSPPTPTSWAPNLESSTICTPLMNTTTVSSSQLPTPPTVATHTAPGGPAVPLPPLAVVDAIMQDPQPSASTTPVIDSLMARQERLQSIRVRLANSAAPSLPPSSQSPPLDPATRVIPNIVPDQPSQSGHSSTSIVLTHPYLASQPSNGAGSSIHDNQTLNDSPLALVPSPTTLTQEFQPQGKAIVAAIQNLNSALGAAHRILVDNENALMLRMRTFEEQRMEFEQMRQTKGVMLQRKFRELEQKREELNAKEVMLASLEKENKAREEARKGVLAKRQAQEEEKRVAEAKRVQEVQEQITAAMNELNEIGALKAKCQVEQLAMVIIQDDLPTEPQEGMNEEEKTVIKSRNELLVAVRHLRRMHTEKVPKLEEATRTLRRLEEERKEREAVEAEQRRFEEEERLRAHAEMERARQVLERRRIEADRKRQVENDRAQARLLVEQQAHAEAQAHGLGHAEAVNGQIFNDPGHPEKVGASQPQGTDTTKIRAGREENSLSQSTTNAMDVDKDGKASAVHRTVPSSDTSPGTSRSKQKKDKPISGGVMLAALTTKASSGHLPPKPSVLPPSLSASVHVAENATNLTSTSPAISISAEGGHKSSFPAQPAPGLSRALHADIRSTPDYKAFSRTPKSQTILDATNAGQELNIGPVAGVSPTQQNVNLRHLKRFRSRAEGNDSGDRSVRTIQVKSEENSSLLPKREDQDDQSHQVVQAPLLMNSPASLPPRPAVIPPPRPRMLKKRHEAPASQPDLSSSYPPEGNEPSSIMREADATTDGQPREALPRDSLSSQPMNAPVQLPAPSEATSSLLLGPVYAEPQPSESFINTSERPNQQCDENDDPAPSGPISVAPSHELDGEDPSRSNRRFTDEHRRARNPNGSRRMTDHYSPPSSRSTVPSPTQPYRRIDSSNGPRAEPMRATSPTAGRKRPSEFSDNEYGHRARRQRGDVWIAEDHDRERVDSYRLQWDRRVDPDERRAAYRRPISPVDRVRPYPSDVPRAPHDNRAYVPEEPAVLATRWELSHRRPENDDAYQRYQLPAPTHNAMEDQYRPDDTNYELIMEERRDTQSDPPLLARIHDTQRFPPRGRGRGEPSRGRGEFARGRGRGVARGGTALLDRLTTGPSSLGDRLT